MTSKHQHHVVSPKARCCGGFFLFRIQFYPHNFDSTKPCGSHQGHLLRPSARISQRHKSRTSLQFQLHRLYLSSKWSCISLTISTRAIKIRKNTINTNMRVLYHSLFNTAVFALAYCNSQYPQVLVGILLLRLDQ